jgi:hypothetical protein
MVKCSTPTIDIGLRPLLGGKARSRILADEQRSTLIFPGRDNWSPCDARDRSSAVIAVDLRTSDRAVVVCKLLQTPAVHGVVVARTSDDRSEQLDLGGQLTTRSGAEPRPADSLSSPVRRPRWLRCFAHATRYSPPPGRKARWRILADERRSTPILLWRDTPATRHSRSFICGDRC